MSLYKRKEFFGSILYDTSRKEYLYCDEFTTFLIDNIHNKNALAFNEEIQQKFNVTQEEYGEIMNTLQALTKNAKIEDVGNAPLDKILSAPLRVFLDFTYECNLRCKHCFTSSGNKKKDELSFEQKKDIIDQMIQMGAYRISLAGGEPLISKEFFPFVEYARYRGVDVSFTTNGTCISRDIIQRLNDLQIRTVTVSLEGADEKDNDLIRGKGAFKRVIKNLSLLSEYYNGTVALRMTMMKHNIKKAHDFVALAEEMGCKKVKFNAMRMTGRAVDNSAFLLSPNEYVNFVREMEGCSMGDIKVVLPLNPFQKDSYNYIKELGFGCVAGKDCISISPEGFVRPCSQLDTIYSDGNCKNKKLIDIWRDGKYFNLYRTLKGNVKCQKCKVYDMCRGGCRYRALQCGDINGLDPYCYVENCGGII